MVHAMALEVNCARSDAFCPRLRPLYESYPWWPSQKRPLNLSHFVARTIWLRRCVSPRRF